MYTIKFRPLLAYIRKSRAPTNSNSHHIAFCYWQYGQTLTQVLFARTPGGYSVFARPPSWCSLDWCCRSSMTVSSNRKNIRVNKYVPPRHLRLDVSSRPPSVDNGMALRQMGISSGTPSFGRRQGRAIMAAVLRACAIANPPFGKVYILDHITWMPTVVT